MRENQIKSRPAIVVMAKVPRSGFVKTRLQPFLTPEQAASLAACFLKDIVANASKIVPDVFVAFYPADGRSQMEELFPSNIKFIAQNGSDLGERLDRTVKEAEARGFTPVIVIGSDSPTLPPEILSDAVDAFSILEREVVLGPTEDGGYYLIGLRTSKPEIFAGISWSTENVYDETLGRAREVGVGDFLELPRWYDIDVESDLIRLYEEVAANREICRQVPQTCRWLRDNSSLFDAILVE